MKQNLHAILFFRWQKLTAHIKQLYIGKKLRSLPFKVRISLFKRWKRYTKKLLSVNHPLLKAVNLFCVAISLSQITNAQCDTLKLSDANNPLAAVTYTSPLTNPGFVDIDNDGDLDCYEVYKTSSNKTGIVFLRNNGTSKVPYYQIDSASGFAFEVINTNFYNDGPKFVDIDGDGDYDCFMVHYSQFEQDFITIDYYKNTGTKTNPHFIKSPKQSPLGGLNGDYFVNFNFADVDQDGDYDFIFSDLYYNNYYKNVGTATNPILEKQVGSANPFDKLFIPGDATFIDWNKDGLVDCITSTGYYKNVGTLGNPAFAKSNKGPVLPPFPFDLYQWADINNDGFKEAFSRNNSMAATAPQATITAQQINNKTVQLNAFPRGNYLYKWRKDGKVILGETNDSIRVTKQGKYTVEIKSGCGTGISLPYIVSNAFSIFSDDESSAIATGNKINVTTFPNPFTSEFVIQLNSSSNQNSVIKIADLNGKIISEFTSTNNIIHAGKQLQRGVYFVQVLQNNVVVFKQKVVKQ
ncbi:MAG: T9SS type A sorting domain-containing protein [Parafilimonas sp.]|nr:T9SS type A sorting domain-containing protein [Parafilimonas sp.]